MEKSVDLDKLFEQTRDEDISNMHEQIQIAIELLRIDKAVKDETD